jgi:hypothetical protein
VIQCGNYLRFALETRQRLRVSGNIPRQELEGDEGVQSGVFGLVDDTPSPPPPSFSMTR